MLFNKYTWGKSIHPVGTIIHSVPFIPIDPGSKLHSEASFDSCSLIYWLIERIAGRVDESG
jgi:hypothetical protein